MPPRTTRQSVSESLVKVAEAAIVKRNMNLTSVAVIQNFIDLAGYNSVIAEAVEHLTISLPAGEGYPAEPIRRCIQLARNVKMLILDLPPRSPASIFNDVHLSKLAVFSTNLPHRLLPAFLNKHPSIDALVLRNCGRSAQCPLRGIELLELTNLQCPSRCFAGIVRGPLTTATINLTRLGSLAQVGLRSLSATQLNTLTVDFFPDDYDILRQVALIMPNLRHLKLNEKPRRLDDEVRSGNTRRPWNNLAEWHRILLRMPFIQELMLRTLIPIAPPPRTELIVVLGWANGTTQRSAAHPTLVRIGVIYRASGGGQVQNHWSKKSAGVWERVTTQAVGPNETFSSL